MENASKALIMAGAVLIALLVISLLVFFYNNIKDLQKVDLTSEEIQKISEFNKQYDVYDRDNIYGSEILSIANKVVDYNLRESDNKGYSKLEVYITFNKDIYNFKKETLYKSSEVKNIVDNLKDSIENDEKTLKYGKKTIAQIASMRDNEKQVFYQTNKFSNDEIKNIKEKILEYSTKKADFLTIKSKTFNCQTEKIKYDKNTGRVEEMYFIEN